MLAMKKMWPLLLLLVACNPNRRPDDVMAPEAMAAFLEEAYLLEGFYAVETQNSYDAMLPEVLEAYNALLAKHGVDKADVERSFDYYARHPEQYLPIQDSVIARLDRAYGDTVAVPDEPMPMDSLLHEIEVK